MRSNNRYLALYKPYGVLSQFTVPDESVKLTLAEFGFPADVYPVGRLDYDSEGLLLLSDDPALNSQLLSPENLHSRSYLAQVENVPSSESLIRLEKGIVIQGKVTRPAIARLLSDDPLLPERPVPIRYRKDIPTAWLELTLTEGRNRQVRKMTAAVGHPTLRLVRIKIGSLSLADLGLAPGEWRDLSNNELQAAMKHCISLNVRNNSL